MAFPSSSSPLVSMTKAKMLRQNSSQAPSRATAEAEVSGCESTSMLMDISLGQLRYTSPQKRAAVSDLPATPALRELMSNDLDLDALSTDDLERLAWEAQEQERLLRSRLRHCHDEEDNDKDLLEKENSQQQQPQTQLDDPMRNITVRSPRRSARRTASPSKAVEAEVHIQTLKSAPLKSARRSKSVTFGRVDEYEISRQSAMSSDLQTPQTRVEASPLGPIEKPSSQSLAKLGQAAVAPPVLPVTTNHSSCNPEQEKSKRTKSKDVVLKVEKKRRSSCASSSLRDTGIRASKVLAPRPRQQRAVVANATRALQGKNEVEQKSVVVNSAHRSSSRAPTAVVTLPSGFRITSTGTLVNKTAPKAPAMTISRTKTTPPAAAASDGVPRANPVPEWLKRRKEQLAEEESERLAQQCERIRLLELKKGKKEAARTLAPPAAAPRPSTLRRSASQGFVSAVDRRLAERAEWEAQRKAREAVLEQERERARLHREEEEEQEYRLERQRTVVIANPLPDWLHTTIRQ